MVRYKMDIRLLPSREWVCVRIQKKDDTIEIIKSLVKDKTFYLCGEHSGKDGSNPHYHFCYEGDTKERDRLRNQLNRQGYKGNSDKAITKKFAPEYYFHEDPEGFEFTLKSPNVSDSHIEYWRDLARQLKAGKKPKSSPEHNDYVVAVLDLARRRGNTSFKAICKMIWEVAHSQGRYYPDARQTERYARYIQGQLKPTPDLFEEMYNDWFRFYRAKKNVSDIVNDSSPPPHDPLCEEGRSPEGDSCSCSSEEDD